MRRIKQRNRISKAYRVAHARLMSILYEEDPDGMGATVGAPEDEYAQPATLLMIALNDASTPEKARRAVTDMYPDATEKLLTDALEVWRAFRASTSTSGNPHKAPG